MAVRRGRPRRRTTLRDRLRRRGPGPPRGGAQRGRDAARAHRVAAGPRAQHGRAPRRAGGDDRGAARPARRRSGGAGQQRRDVRPAAARGRPGLHRRRLLAHDVVRPLEALAGRARPAARRPVGRRRHHGRDHAPRLGRHPRRAGVAADLPTAHPAGAARRRAGCRHERVADGGRARPADRSLLARPGRAPDPPAADDTRERPRPGPCVGLAAARRPGWTTPPHPRVARC